MKRLTPSISLPQQQVAVVVLLLLLAAASWRQDCDAASGFCASKCAVRCGRAPAKGRGRGTSGGGGGCLRSCGLCCEECNCVPTAARDECPCYRDMLTAGPRKTPKCP
ncbi:hypothetical protein GUJ93_ZPchr0013g35484 [Zizania palustris]|uniref:Uncharacterized protein n=1 Tax=Zizania palustris TaxID=103762 RepID=A0A8J5WTJ0_ZIZPA|nr:hypothetical protein GUJ93_ZPchr0013g35484 [Zizania palustris]